MEDDAALSISESIPHHLSHLLSHVLISSEANDILCICYCIFR